MSMSVSSSASTAYTPPPPPPTETEDTEDTQAAEETSDNSSQYMSEDDVFSFEMQSVSDEGKVNKTAEQKQKEQDQQTWPSANKEGQ